MEKNAVLDSLIPQINTSLEKSIINNNDKNLGWM